MIRPNASMPDHTNGGRRPRPSSAGRTKVLAVASGGGHFIQLMRIAPAFQKHEVVYVTTLPGYRQQVAPARFYVVNDANIRNKFDLLRMAVRLAWIVLRERPAVVISTGAAPGYFCIRLGKLLRARTIWVDSIANADRLSLSGRHVRRHADLWLTQWPHLSEPDGPQFRGAVV
jgi:UDP-N-acetylglucosamine:LPS N-acetylglucosamine transferase